MLSEIAYLQGCLEAERGQVDFLQSDIRSLKGRMVVMFNRAVKMDVWIHHIGAPEPVVNDEDE